MLFRSEWWKNVPVKDNKGNPIVNTIKTCPGFIEYYSKNSITIPLWSSFIFIPGYDNNCSYEFANKNKEHLFIPQHRIMRGNKYLRHMEQFKLYCPWLINEKSGIDFLYVQDFYNFKHTENFIIPPGVLNFKYQHTTGIHFLSNPDSEQKNHKIQMEAGQPLVKIFPLSEKKIKLKNNFVDDIEYKKLQKRSEEHTSELQSH